MKWKCRPNKCEARYGASQPLSAIVSVYETQLAQTIIDNILGTSCQIMRGVELGDFIALIDIWNQVVLIVYFKQARCQGGKVIYLTSSVSEVTLE